MSTPHLCIICGRDFYPATPDAAICHACGGPPEAPPPETVPQPTMLYTASQDGALSQGTVFYRAEEAISATHLCILCGRDFVPRSPDEAICPACRGEEEIASTPQPILPIPSDRSERRPVPAEADVPLEWQEGDVILDLYEVRGELGRGAMGAVYRVHHRQWNIDLAVKTPLAEMLTRSGGSEQFSREAEAWVELGLHPHIVTCYYVRNLGGVPRVFAECVEGGSLRDWIRSRKLYEGGHAAALERILDVAIQMAWGLGYAHEKGLVHQDVKPANVLLTPEGMAKVTDFGLVGAKGYTQAYAAPEQILGGEVDARSDIWAWGVLVLEMFTGGVTWFSGDVAASVLEGYLESGAEEAVIPSMPQELAALLRQCFENEPAQRPQRMDAVAERVQAVYAQEVGRPYPRQKPQALDLRADALNNKAVSLLDLGREEEAVRCWQEALAADPAHLEANFNYGYYRWQRAEMLGSEFLTRLQQLESSHGGNPEYWRLLGWVYLEQGYVEEVEAILRERGVEDEALRRAHHAPDRPVGREVRCFQGHTHTVRSVAFSPDGRYALSGSEDRTLRLWDVATGREVRCFKGHSDEVNSVAFSPDGRYALSGSNDDALRLWEVAAGRKMRRFKGDSSYVDSVVFSPDGRYALSGGVDSTLRLWDAATGREVRRFERHTGYVNSVAFSPDGRYALSGSEDRTLRLWDVATGREVRRFDGRTDWVLSVAFSPDGRYVLSGSEDETLRLWDVATGREVRRFDGRTDWVSSVAFSPDGRYALSGSEDRTLRLWEIATGREVRRFEGHTSMVTSVAFSPDGRYALSGSDDKTLRLWEVASGRELRCFEGHTNWVKSVAFSPDGCYALSGSYDETLRLWEVATGREVRRFDGRTDWVLSVAFSPDGRYALSGSGDHTLQLWEVTTGQEVRRFEGHTLPVTSAAFSPDGRYVLSGSGDNTLQLWELDWEWEFPDPADWDEGARPYLEIFLTLHTPYGPDGLSRQGRPQWTEEDFQRLLKELGYRGCGWLRPEGVRRELEKMAKERG